MLFQESGPTKTEGQDLACRSVNKIHLSSQRRIDVVQYVIPKEGTEEVENFLLAVIARFKAFKKRVPSYSNSKRPQGVSASKAKSSVLSQLSGLEMLYLMISSTISRRT